MAQVEKFELEDSNNIIDMVGQDKNLSARKASQASAKPRTNDDSVVIDEFINAHSDVPRDKQFIMS